MSILFLMLQGGLIGVVAGWAYPDWEWQFFAILLANALLTVGYGAEYNDGRLT